MFPIKKLHKILTRETTPEPAAETEVIKEPATEPKLATKVTKTKTKQKISSSKFDEKFLNKSKMKKKNMFLIKVLYEGNQNKKDKIVKNINESLINLRSSINSKEIRENENLKKIVNIVEKIMDFNKQKKGK